MDQVEIYIALFAIIATVSILFRNSKIPTSLLLVIVGMLISYLPGFPHIHIDTTIIFDIFLPLLLYEASAYSSSWKDIKPNFRPIVLLSIGHVLFITGLVACAMVYLIPQIGWPLAFALGAVISPPDDVAILDIAEKIRLPSRVINVLKGEAMFNDATALIIYRFALIAMITHQFSITQSITSFFVIVIGETLYGLAVGFVIGELRLRVREPILQMLISILTPFLAYLPAMEVAGSGVVATVVTGLYIGHRYWDRYPPDVRLTARAIWATLGFVVQSTLFLWVGLDLRYTMQKNAYIPSEKLLLYSSVVVAVVIIGRFAWCFPTAYLPRWLFRSIRESEPELPWQYPFIVSWAGMRGGISLAAALAVPTLPFVAGYDPRELLIFLVFCVIIATLLLQGLTLPWVMKLIGAPVFGEQEIKLEQTAELNVRAAMANATIHWLNELQNQAEHNVTLLTEIQMRIQEYTAKENQLKERLDHYLTPQPGQNNENIKKEIDLLSEILKVERKILLLYWQENKIDTTLKNKLELQLDLMAKHAEEMN